MYLSKGGFPRPVLVPGSPASSQNSRPCAMQPTNGARPQGRHLLQLRTSAHALIRTTPGLPLRATHPKQHPNERLSAAVEDTDVAFRATEANHCESAAAGRFWAVYWLLTPAATAGSGPGGESRRELLSGSTGDLMTTKTVGMIREASRETATLASRQI